MRKAMVRFHTGGPRSVRTGLLTALLVLVAMARPAIGEVVPQLAAVIVLRDSPSVSPVFVPVGSAVTPRPFGGLFRVPFSDVGTEQTYFETSVKVDVTGFTRACFTLDYEGTPSGLTLDIADTILAYRFPNPNLSSSVARVVIQDQTVTMYSAGVGPGEQPGLPATEVLATQPLNLVDVPFKVCVGNGLVTWGNPAGSVSTHDTHLGFRIPDNAPATEFSAAGDGNRDIYASFNRILGAPFVYGVGLARVYITLE